MRPFSTLLTLALAGISPAQTLFTEDFEGAPGFTLNTTDANSVAGVANSWVVNNVFAGGNGVADCSGFPLDFSIPATASQPVGISNPNGNYLHTASLVAVANNILNCSFGAADGFCTNPDDVFARMSTDVSTVGETEVSLRFWWLCNGGNQNYGEVYYSTNGGVSWLQVTAPLAQYRNTTNWGEQTVSLPEFGQQATLRFGFRFHNGTSFLGGSDPGFAIDDVRIIASDTEPVSIATVVAPLGYCQGASLSVTYAVTGTFNVGNVFTAQLSDASGSFAAPVAIGSMAGITGGSINAVIPPGTIPGSGYRIRVTGSSPATTGSDNGTDIAVYLSPYAGIDAGLNTCSGDDPVPLTTGGDAGGTWTGPSPVIGGLYDPGTMDPGTYTYVVVGTGPCAADSAIVLVTESSGGNAGSSSSTVICKNTGIYDLFDYLGGQPDAGGTWTGPGGAPSDGLFNSAIALAGVYTYTVDVGGSCGTDEAVVSVTLGEPGEAGPDGTWTICADELPVDLFDMLDVSANLTGVWFSNGAPFDGEAEAAGDYVYIDYADAPCANDTAFITLDASQAAYAGENGTVQVCLSDPPLELFSALTGGPQPGGVWTAPGGSPHSGTFIPGTDAFGLYTYTVDALEPCDADEAVLAVVQCEVGIAEAAAPGQVRWLGRVDGAHVFEVPPMSNGRIELLDAAGRTIRNQSQATVLGPLRIDAAGLPAGILMLRMRSLDRCVTGRFMN